MVSLDYLAGFFDGEGCVMTHRNMARSYTVMCAVGNTRREILDLFQIRFGGSIRIREYKNHPNWKPLWMWEIKDRSAEAFLKDMLPMLQLKKLQAELALELLALIPRRGCYSKQTYDRLTPEERQAKEDNFSRRDVLIAAIKTANKRGLN